MHPVRLLAAGTLALALVGAAAAAPSVFRQAPAAIDIGSMHSAAPQAQVRATVALKLRNSDEMLNLLNATYTPGNAQYHRFLSSDEFAARFAPSAETVARVTRQLEAAGLTVTRVGPSHLSVSGTAAAMEAAFATSLHDFEVQTASSAGSLRFHAPVTKPRLPQAIADAVQAVIGLNSRPNYRPHLRSRPLSGASRLPATTAAAAGTINPPGELTVADVAQVYDVNPLYAAGLSGRHTTLGIITLAEFTPSDAFAYWSALGLPVSSNRLKEVEVDGGAGAPNDDAGSLETTIDVEQSGGLAPGAKIIVYVAPNTNQAFIDAFAKAIFSNQADTISCSWGEWEWADLAAQGNTVTDPTNGQTRSALQALNDLLTEAALQGQSVFIASGDSGAYDSTEFFAPPSWPVPRRSVVLSVDDPAAQQFVTAAGGTTLPGAQVYGISATQTLTINVPTEQAWGWDYLIPLCTALGLDPLSCGIYPAGGGGGVSAYVSMPSYQKGVAGMRRTADNQVLYDYSQSPPAFVVRLPEEFSGRNVPDVSLNGDPQTGYAVYYTSSVQGFGIQTFWGGTSFCAPQLNGITALFDDAADGRVGLLNFALYQLARSGSAYSGHHPPLRDISAGDNWGYRAGRGYDQASGLGVPDVANLLSKIVPRSND